MSIIFLAVVLILVSITLASMFVEVQQQEVKIIERFGKYSRTFNAGMNWKKPFIESAVETLSLKLQLLPVQVETKTKDNVFVTVTAVVQYMIQAGHEADAYYKLQDPKQQLQAYVFDNIRSEIPTMDLDTVFSSKDQIALAVDTALAETMTVYGYTIQKVLITEITPAQSVRDAMDEIQTQTRLALAAAQKGEAQKVLAIKNAEAEKETKRLNGEGIAAEREAIVKGLKDSVEELAAATSTKPDAAMQILMQTQYYDTIKSVGTAPGSRVIMIPFGADGASRVREAILEANLAVE